MTRYWIGVASHDHVKIAEAGGFCQFNHGKEAPVRRLSPGDGLVYYAPRTSRQNGAPLQSFVAIGTLCAGNTYQAQQSDCFHPRRRDVQYRPSSVAPIAPLLSHLSFSAGGANWGMVMRRGLFEITGDDFEIIAQAMKAADLVDHR